MTNHSTFKKMTYQLKWTVLAFIVVAFALTSTAQDDIEIVTVGKASYGKGTPFNLALETWGSDNNWRLYDQLRALHGQWPEKWHIGVPDTNTRSIPTNNFWSGMVFQENNSWGGMNWVYPGTISFNQNGSEVWFPNQWSNDGSSMDWGWGMQIEPQDHRNFTPESCTVTDWDDWRVVTELANSTDKMVTTFVQGMPYFWFDVSFNPTLKIFDAPYTTNGSTPINSWPYTGDAFVGVTSGRMFAIFMPPNTTVSKDGNNFTLDFAGDDQYFVIGLLNDASEFEMLKEHAYRKPIKTQVDWAYHPEQAQVDVNWTIEAENLLGGNETEVLQGFLPHQYQHAKATPTFNDMTYLTAKGTAKYATGNSFDFSYHFTGVLPHISAPELLDNVYPYDSTFMANEITKASTRNATGDDIYWGLKPLLRQAKYFAMAKETNHPAADQLKNVCLSAFKDWMTYEPGETKHCFYRYDEASNLDALVGFDPGGYSATFTDHDMCYGYMVYAAALYSMYEPEFLDDYGDFLVLMSKHINNWDRNDQDYPFMRLFEPWTGHNWAGGTGGGGNNVESLSEGMQFWAGMFILGEQMGNTEMRDAAAFGYMSMSRAFDQYYRDIDDINFSDNFDQDVAAMLWTSGPAYGNYVGNEAIYWMNWIPYSPAMNYMYSDRDAAEFQYESFAALWNQNSGNWGADFWNNLNMYITGFDAELAAQQRMQNAEKFTTNDLSGISYYYLHANRNLGDIVWERYCDHPLSQVYYNSDLDQYTYVCYNSIAEEIEVTAFENGDEIGTFKVPAYTLVSTHLDPVLTSIEILGEKDVLLPNESMQLVVMGLDQHGGSMDLEAAVSWEVLSGGGSISESGEYTAGVTEEDEVIIQATSGDLTAQLVLKVGDPRTPISIEISPSFVRVPTNGVAYFEAMIYDQYGDLMNADAMWTVSGGGTMDSDAALFQSNGSLGTYFVEATINGLVVEGIVVVYEPSDLADNLALNRPAFSDSERGGQEASKGNDGNENSQWQSAHAFEEGDEVKEHWWSVELDTVYDIHQIDIVWDVSASVYVIQYSDDNVSWITADSIVGSTWWSTDEIDMYANGVSTQYLRVYCYTHDGDYGYAIKEFRAYGEKSQGPGVLSTLQINPAQADDVQVGETRQFTVRGYDVKGNEIAMNGQWAVNSGGSISQSGLFAGEVAGGPYEVTFTQGNVTATSEVTVIPDIVLQVQKPQTNIDVQLWPVPATQTLSFSHSLQGEVQLVVVSIDGKIMHNAVNSTAVDVRAWPAGIYLAQFKSTDGQIVKSFAVR